MGKCAGQNRNSCRPAFSELKVVRMGHVNQLCEHVDKKTARAQALSRLIEVTGRPKGFRSKFAGCILSDSMISTDMCLA